MKNTIRSYHGNRRIAKAVGVCGSIREGTQPNKPAMAVGSSCIDAPLWEVLQSYVPALQFDMSPRLRPLDE